MINRFENNYFDYVVSITTLHNLYNYDLSKSIKEIERVGIRKKNYEILSIKVPHIELPVAPGRDMASLVEVAALDQKLKTFGHDSAIEFDKKFRCICFLSNYTSFIFSS